MKQPGASVSRETLERLRLFESLLTAWNRRINLVGDTTTASLWSRHIHDSLRLLPLLPQEADLAIDLGSGAGLPGLVVAVATGLRIHLIEADRRKAAFLREAARMTGAPVTVHAVRIETRPCGPAPLIMSRALAPLPRLLDLAMPMLTPGGTCLFHKGRNVETELAAACKSWAMTIERFDDQTDPGSVVLRLTHIARV